MKQEELIQTNINEEKLYESEIKSEQRINSSDKEININDYSEIIPQKIEKEKYYISTENDDIFACTERCSLWESELEAIFVTVGNSDTAEITDVVTCII